MKKKLTAIIIACIAVVVVIALLVTHMNPGGTKKEAGQKAAETSVSAESEPETDTVSEGVGETAEDSTVPEAGSAVSETVQEPESTEENRPDDNSLPVIPPEEGGTEIIRDDEPQEPQTTPTPVPQEPQPTENPEPPADDGRDTYETPIIIDPD